MKNIGFAVRLEVDTPVSLRGLLHLDGLLAALAVDRGMNLEDIPLEKHAGIWKGSAAILETGIYGAVLGEQIRLKHVVPDAVPAGLFSYLKPAQRKIGEMSPMRNRLSTYPLLDGVLAVWFTGCGDPDAVFDLLHDARNVGAMGRTGYGRITARTLQTIKDSEIAGLALSSGIPARCMPVETWDGLNLPRPDSAILSMQRFKPPYWAGEESICISPMQIDIGGTYREIETLASVI